MRRKSNVEITANKLEEWQREWGESDSLPKELIDDLFDEFSGALPFFINPVHSHKLVRPGYEPPVELDKLTIKKGEAWVLFCSLEGEFSKRSLLRPDGFLLPLQWKSGAETHSNLLPDSLHNLAERIIEFIQPKLPEGGERWTIHPAEMFKSKIDFKDPNLFGDNVDSGWGALACGLEAVSSGKDITQWPFSSFHYLPETRTFEDVRGIKKKLAVAASFYPVSFWVAPTQESLAKRLLKELVSDGYQGLKKTKIRKCSNDPSKVVKNIVRDREKLIQRVVYTTIGALVCLAVFLAFLGGWYQQESRHRLGLQWLSQAQESNSQKDFNSTTLYARYALEKLHSDDAVHRAQARNLIGMASTTPVLLNVKFQSHHNAVVEGVQFSSEDKYIASWTNDNVIIWNTAIGKKACEYSVIRGDSRIASIAFSPDSKILHIGNRDGSIFFWDIKNKLVSKRVNGHDERVTCMVYSNDGKYFITGDKNGHIDIRDAAQDYEKLKSLDTKYAVRNILPLQDNQSCIVLSSRHYRYGGEYLYKLDTDERKITSLFGGKDGVPTELESKVYSVSHSVLDDTIVMGVAEGLVFLNTKTGDRFNRRILGDRVFEAVFPLTDDKVLAFGGQEKSVSLCGVQDKYCDDFRYFGQGVNTCTLSHDKTMLVTGYDDGGLKVMKMPLTELPPSTTLKEREYIPEEYFYSGAGGKLAMLGEYGQIGFWNAWSDEKEMAAEKAGNVTVLRYSLNGEKVVSGTIDGGVFVIDPRDGKVIERIRGDGDNEGISNIDVSENGERVVTGSDGGVVTYYYQLGNGERLSKRHKANGEITSVALSFSDKSIVGLTTSENRITLWDTATDVVKSSIEIEYLLEKISFIPETDKLVSASGSKVMIWEQEQTQLVNPVSLKYSDAIVTSLAVSPDGAEVAAGYDNGDIVLWSLIFLEKNGVLTNHSTSITDLSYSSNGKVLFATSSDKEMNFFDMSGGNKIIAKDKEACIDHTFYLKSKKLMACQSQNKEMLLWDPTDFDVKTSKSFGSFDRSIYGFKWSYDESRFAVKYGVQYGDGDDFLTPIDSAGLAVYDFVTEEKLFYSETTTDYNRAIAFSPDNRYLATSLRKNSVSLIDLLTKEKQYIELMIKIAKAKGARQAQLYSAGRSSSAQTSYQTRHGLAINKDRNGVFEVKSLSFSPDNNVLAVIGFGEKYAILWDMADGKRLRNIVHNEEISSLTFTAPNSVAGKKMLIASDGEVVIYNKDDWSIEKSFTVVGVPDDLVASNNGMLAYHFKGHVYLYDFINNVRLISINVGVSQTSIKPLGFIASGNGRGEVLLIDSGENEYEINIADLLVDMNMGLPELQVRYQKYMKEDELVNHSLPKKNDLYVEKQRILSSFTE